MDEYPDPQEEYELLYQQEMEAVIEMVEEVSKEQSKRKRSKNSLSFDSPSLDKKNECNDSLQSNVSTPVKRTTTESNKKRRLSSESLADINSDLEFVEQPAKKPKSDVQEKTNRLCGITYLKVPDGPFMSVSTDLGEKLYVKISHDHLPVGTVGTTKYEGNKTSGLLTTPYSELKTKAEESLKKNKELSNNVLDTVNAMKSNVLWVEKYKPKTYFDLLSDETVNRTLLNWLKLWDKVVFNKEVKTKSGNNNSKFNLNFELDKDGRPRYKIALLCGPPGLGKTTLAHVASDLAGYSVLEVNASDDRTVEALGAKLEAATQIQSVIGDRRPHCLVLDEIDGAPVQTIDFLLKYLSGKNNEKVKKGKKEKKGKQTVVKRPIICICNEPYTPSLRQLRQQSFIVHFPHTSSTKLAQRLLEICRKQNLKTDLSALTLLCEKAQNDIRSCISTLSFFKSKKDQTFKSADVMKSDVGQKDIHKGLFTLWREIFYSPVRRGNFFSNVIEKGKDETSYHLNYSKKAMDKLQDIVRMFQLAGSHERLLQGVFENFPTSKFTGSVGSLSTALQWFSWFDMLDSNIKKNQAFVLMPYLPYGFAAWHFLFSSNSFSKINFPNVGYENYLKEMRSKQILNDVLRGFGATARSYNSANAMLLDVLPMFNFILTPSIRAVNPTLFNEREKKDFKQIVDVMIEYGLSLMQQRSMDGTYFYQYDPNIEELSRFNLTNPSDTRSFPYILKQIISHEVELEKLRRSDTVASATGTTTTSQVTDDSKDKPKSDSEKKSNVVKEPPAKPKEKNIKENETQYRDFFGRIVKIKDTSHSKEEVSELESVSHQVKGPVWYSFKEGYNNAVKKDITIANIL